jgi:hypothetical protein
MKSAAATDNADFVSDGDRVLTATETARMLGVSEFTLLRKRRQPGGDGLPFVRLSTNRIGYRLNDLRAFLAARRVGSLDGA